ncbi:winged helix-turn-helix transcriptional regulator [Nocardia anaemiae]|uniref:winged helix-turn-helix transcriptional regulator n=1 Tax=Nocardia anaemiae TaxID=263910 RepID=UPI0027D8B1B0|nr:helix-turn-helix domain-containing protein [Nocardia anaemiae]
MANKWTMLVMGALADGPVRFGQLRRRLDGITQKMLTQTLRNLERDGLITRALYPTVPPRVEYSVTELGRSVLGLLTSIRVWSEVNINEVLAARYAYDERVEHDPEPITTAS